MNKFWNYERTRKTGLASSFFLTLVLVSAFSSPAALADDNDHRGRGNWNERRNNIQQRVENRRDQVRSRIENRRADFGNRRAEAFRNHNRAEAFRQNRSDAFRNQNRANIQYNRASNNRWDRSDRRRFQATRRFNNWNDQRTYLRSNLYRFNQMSRLNQLQQRQLDAQMRAAFLAYHNNRWAGSYGWNEYSDPMFLDYLQTNNSSLLQSILAALGMVGGGLVDGGYGYSGYDYSGYDGYPGNEYGGEEYMY